MKHVFNLRLFSLILIWGGGILLALASKSYDPDEDEIIAPVDVNVVITNSGDFEIDNNNTKDVLSAILVSAQFEKGGNDAITLREIPITLDTSTQLNADITPSDPSNELSGELAIEVTQDIAFGIDRVPEQGQLSVNFNGTTTVVTFDGDRDNVVQQVASETLPAISLGELRTQFSDEDVDVNERAASKAYRLLENIWLYARIAESLTRDIDDQSDMLESIGLLEPLSIDCSNLNSDPLPSYSLTWASDAAGAGEGTAGSGDSFRATWDNCNIASDDRFLSRDLELNEYLKDNESSPRQMSFNADYAFIISTSEIVTTVLAIDRDEVSGTLNISATELVSTP